MTRFLIDAQLPSRLKHQLARMSCEAIHTDDLEHGSRTSDIDIASLAIAENRILITKDSDFLKLKILNNVPKQLLLITTGNITNSQLFGLFERNFDAILKLFSSFDVVELNNRFVTGHDLN
jgi:predicted nuclease of predicted toxin-antitoxin system